MVPKGPHRQPSRKGETGANNVLPLLKAQYAVSKVLAAADDLDSALAQIIASICMNLGWELGAYWQYAPNQPVLRCTHISAAQESLGTFIAASRENEILPGEGLPGRVFSTSEPSWIPDLQSDQNFTRSAAAQKAGLQSAFAFPVLVGNDAIAVLEFLSSTQREPDYELLETMASLGRQIGQFIKRKEAEEAVTQSFELYRSLTDSASDAIITMDESSNILLANRATEDVFGYSVSELKGQSLMMLMPPAYRIRHEQSLARYLETGKKHLNWHGMELPGLRKDGQEILMEVSFGEFELKDRRFFTGFMRDITQRKKVETVLKSTERLAVIGRLATSIAHEINNPLDAIKNIFYLLEQNATDEQRSHLQTGEQELNRVAEIARRTLSFSRETPAITEVNAHDVLDETLELLSRKIQTKHIEIHKRYRSRGTVHANVGELRQVFVNLIANALDALPIYGHLWLRSSTRVSKSRAEGLIITIGDNGQGIPPRFIPHLFQPFFTTKGEHGTGLGLWITREILQKYSATIRVRSRIGDSHHGTCFRIFFPSNAGQGKTACR
ncbi:MAG TPA: PAS domain S-box protein [Candidatus Angelobacter sp.]|jgi:PAS domain S-box-containing protein|nr:PAS domain S-box protein [Candidatus Angelobacter sp.]